jgi:hypothetical protein
MLNVIEKLFGYVECDIRVPDTSNLFIWREFSSSSRAPQDACIAIYCYTVSGYAGTVSLDTLTAFLDVL